MSWLGSSVHVLRVERLKHLNAPTRLKRAYAVDPTDFDRAFQRNPRTVARYDRMEAVQRAASSQRAHVLELGCGTGRLLATCEGRARIGIDLSPNLLRGARDRGLMVAVADAMRLPFVDNSFDAIVSGNAVVRHLDYAPLFRECARVLRDGGLLALHTFSAHAFAFRDLFRWSPRGQPDPLNLQDIRELTEPAAAAGLNLESFHVWRATRFPPYVIELPLPPALALRLGSHVIAVFRSSKPAA